MSEWRRPAGRAVPGGWLLVRRQQGTRCPHALPFQWDSLEALGEDGLLLHVLDAAGDTVRTMEPSPRRAAWT